MADIAIGGAIAALRFETAYQVRAAAMQRQTQELQGDLALKLIEASAIDPAVGGNIDLLI